MPKITLEHLAQTFPLLTVFISILLQCWMLKLGWIFTIIKGLDFDTIAVGIERSGTIGYQNIGLVETASVKNMRGMTNGMGRDDDDRPISIDPSGVF